MTHPRGKRNPEKQKQRQKRHAQAQLTYQQNEDVTSLLWRYCFYDQVNVVGEKVFIESTATYIYDDLKEKYSGSALSGIAQYLDTRYDFGEVLNDVRRKLAFMIFQARGEGAFQNV